MSSLSIEYAKALYDLSTSSKMKHEILSLFDASLSMLDEGLSKVIFNPKIKIDEKKEIIEKIFDKSIYRDFLLVLLDNNRLNILEEIKLDYQELINEENKIIDVKVYSKELLSDEYLESLKIKLEKRIGSKLRLINLIDDTIIGGVRINYDSKEKDLTINQKFDDLKMKLKE